MPDELSVVRIGSMFITLHFDFLLLQHQREREVDGQVSGKKNHLQKAHEQCAPYLPKKVAGFAHMGLEPQRVAEATILILQRR